MTNTTAHTSSLLSTLPFLSTFTWWEVLVPASLVSLSVLLRALDRQPNTPTRSLVHVYPAKTAHARFLPTVAKHVFSYPVLFFGFDLDALEAGELDLGRAFGYQPPRRTLTSFTPGGYLGKGKDGTQSIRDKLNELMRERGVPLSLVERVYTVSMPAYLGIEGINPLTTHFGYSVDEDGNWTLRAVVLEVHNTFGETHVYLLRVGVDEDDKPTKG